MTVDEWFNQNYKAICKIAGYYTDDKSLITHYYLWLVKHPNRWVKIGSIPHDEQMRFTNTWLKNNTRWASSDFNKENKLNNFDEIWDDDYSGEVQESVYMEIGSENTSDDIKEWLLDINNNFGERGDILIKIRYIYLDMETTDKVLYDLYFTNMMSIRGIATKLNIPNSSVHVMLTELKSKLRTLCGQTQSTQ